jgi:hypothetical protein
MHSMSTHNTSAQIAETRAWLASDHACSKMELHYCFQPCTGDNRLLLVLVHCQSGVKTKGEKNMNQAKCMHAEEQTLLLASCFRIHISLYTCYLLAKYFT